MLSNYTNAQLQRKLRNQAIVDSDSDAVSVYNSFYGFAKETYPKFYFEEICYLPFEDIKIPVPKYYDEILTRLYGNWHQIPPEKERYPDYLDDMIYIEIS